MTKIAINSERAINSKMAINGKMSNGSIGRKLVLDLKIGIYYPFLAFKEVKFLKNSEKAENKLKWLNRYKWPNGHK